MFQIVSLSFDFVLKETRFIKLELLTVILVSIQLLFSHCEICWNRAFSDPYFPICWQNHIWFSLIWTESLILSKYRKIWIWFCPYTGKYESEKVHISAYFMQCPPEHFQLYLRKNISSVSAQKSFVCKYMNCLTVQKSKTENSRCTKFNGIKVCFLKFFKFSIIVHKGVPVPPF